MRLPLAPLHLRALAVLVVALALPIAIARADDTSAPADDTGAPADGTGVRADDTGVRADDTGVRADDTGVRADDEALRSRIAALEEAAERAGATELLVQARRALLTSDRLRVSGDDAGAGRAERIADAAVRAVQRRVEAHRARSDRDAARARLVELEERARIAREALERARAERERRQREPSVAPARTPAPTATGAPAEE